MFCLNSATILSVKISAVIITFNEEKNIAHAIKSLDWADEIVVIDSESTDTTREIVRKSGAKLHVQEWLGFGKQKQLAVDLCENDWVFSLDADERVSDSLRSEILFLKNLDENELADGYKIPRLTFYMNRPIRHGGWYPDWQLRFFNRKKGQWKDVFVHESVKMLDSAVVKKLKSDIFHYSVEGASYHHQMIGQRYAPLAAEQMFVNGKRTSPLKIAFSGFIAFFQTYIIKGGFLDGFPGFCIAKFAAHHAFLKHLLLWEKQNRENKFM